MYKLVKAPMGVTHIQRLSDGAFISTDPSSPDYKRYLSWVAEGNTPEPVDE